MKIALQFLLTLAVACALVGCGASRARHTDDHLVVYSTDRNLGSTTLGPQLILGAWPDGTVIWSENRLNGGSPYYTATVKPEVLAEALQALKARGFFRDGNHSYYGPDSQCTSIAVRTGDDYVELHSWHELFEQGGLGIGEHFGLTDLDSRNFYDTIANQPREHLLFRLRWYDARMAASHLRPAVGKPTSGSLVIENDVATWKHGPEDGG